MKGDPVQPGPQRAGELQWAQGPKQGDSAKKAQGRSSQEYGTYRISSSTCGLVFELCIPCHFFLMSIFMPPSHCPRLRPFIVNF